MLVVRRPVLVFFVAEAVVVGALVVAAPVEEDGLLEVCDCNEVVKVEEALVDAEMTTLEEERMVVVATIPEEVKTLAEETMISEVEIARVEAGAEVPVERKYKPSEERADNEILREV